MLHISNIFLINEIAAVVLGILANSLLYYLIIYASTRDLSSYTRLLKLHCICDVVYLLINALTSLRVIYIGKQIFMVVFGPLSYLSKGGAAVSCCLFTYAFFSELTFVPIDYYFRFVMVCHNDPFTNLRFAVCIGIAFFITAFHTLLSSNATMYGPSKETIIYWSEIRKVLDLKERMIPFGVLDPDSPKMNATLAFATVITFLVYFIIGYTTFRIHRTLAENALRRVRKESSHVRQITLVMIVQAILPFIVLAIPILVVTALSVFGITVEIVGYMITILISWTPVLKPCLTIYIIKPYRRSVKRKFLSRVDTSNTIENSVSNADNSQSNSATKTSKISTSIQDD